MDVPSSNSEGGFKLEGAMPVIPERKSVGEAFSVVRDPATLGEVKPCAPSSPRNRADVAASPSGSIMMTNAHCVDCGGAIQVARARRTPLPRKS